MAIVYGTTNSEMLDKSDDVTERAEPISGCSGNNSIFRFADHDLIFWGETAQPPPCGLAK